MEERRRYVRIPDSSQISYRVIPAQTKGEYVTRDISCGGIKFLTHQFISKDSLLRIRLTLDKASLTFEGIVKVMWVREIPHSLSHEIGVQFVDIPQKAAECLLDYIRVFLQSPK